MLSKEANRGAGGGGGGGTKNISLIKMAGKI